MATTASVLKYGRKPATAISKSCSNYRQNVSADFEMGRGEK
jgi:hypothetical protein